jgi:hypothetical protein
VSPEPEGSSPHSQELASGPYPEPGESTPHPPNQSPQPMKAKEEKGFSKISTAKILNYSFE